MYGDEIVNDQGISDVLINSDDLVLDKLSDFLNV